MTQILALRKAAGFSQQELAEKMKVSSGAVSQWEKGETFPASDKLPELARLLNCSIDDLFRKGDST